MSTALALNPLEIKPNKVDLDLAIACQHIEEKKYELALTIVNTVLDAGYQSMRERRWVTVHY